MDEPVFHRTAYRFRWILAMLKKLTMGFLADDVKQACFVTTVAEICSALGCGWLCLSNELRTTKACCCLTHYYGPELYQRLWGIHILLQRTSLRLRCGSTRPPRAVQAERTYTEKMALGHKDVERALIERGYQVQSRPATLSKAAATIRDDAAAKAAKDEELEDLKKELKELRAQVLALMFQGLSTSQPVRELPSHANSSELASTLFSDSTQPSSSQIYAG
ncbi:hypothetical protein SISNIDRAFT_493564 [Sistotremastrum niveocremeum HHB9708]|uniref:Uncharacterized protein n=1 Tax=Sistotremastrum niveocremeum HHB9708 TaxID=1314777 RepID=A0A164Y5S1_9AGAM|nr:hypothetical protein SISNIDRAFT_493564 [Sistotremastrum niveocremeum HHB9708]